MVFDFPGDWRILAIEECVEALIDYRGKSPEKTTYGVPLITAKVVKNGRIVEPEEYIAADSYDEWMRRGMPLCGDVVMTTEAPLGEIAQLDERKVALAQRLITLRGKRRLLDNTYLKYLMQSEFVQTQLRARATGTTVLGIRQSELRRVRLAIPPLVEQRAIANVLNILDKKIDLNHRTNETLESIARAIFKSWFVDFDPVRAKADGRRPAGMEAETAALFPSRVQEDGGIPEGWNQQTIGDIATRVSMGPFGSRITRDNFVSSGVPVIRGNNLTDGFSEGGFVYLTPEKADDLRSANAFPGDIVFTHRGTLGQVGLIPQKPAHPRYVVSQSQMLLSVDPIHVSPHLVYQYFRSETGQTQLLANTNTTGVPAIARPTTSLKAISIVVPTPKVSTAFERIASALSDKQVSNERESVLLSALRDALLPKLLSGELRIRDAEKLVEAHT
jgi:type I restriction enzyme S subunit